MGMKAIDLIRAEQYRQQQENNTHDSTGQLQEIDALDEIDAAMEDIGLFLDSIEIEVPEKRHLIEAAARLAIIIDGLNS